MRAFRSTLVALAIAFAAVAALHFLLGLGADRLLGIELDQRCPQQQVTLQIEGLLGQRRHLFGQ